MKKWLIVLCLAASAAAPVPAMAAERPPEVPFWTRLLAVIAPSTPAARPFAERHYRHEHSRMTAAGGEANSAHGRARHPLRQGIETAASGGGQLRLAEPRQAHESVGLAIESRDVPPLPYAAPSRAISEDSAAAALTSATEEIPPLPRATPRRAVFEDNTVFQGTVFQDTASEGTASQETGSAARSGEAVEVPLPHAAPRRTARQDIFDASPQEDDAVPGPAAPPSRARPASEDDCNGGQRIISAYYWEGRHTASGEPFNPNGMTAAHRTLPFGTRVTVSNPRTGRSVTVVINDRGPYVRGVGLDLSLAAAKAIGMHGTGSVCIS
jgi:peptidoglycan lytic transglycosylase